MDLILAIWAVAVVTVSLTILLAGAVNYWADHRARVGCTHNCTRHHGHNEDMERDIEIFKRDGGF